jgi:pyocin large subunit-like protein
MSVQFTRGFRSLLHRSDHFAAHGARLGVTSEQEYETLADAIFGPPSPDVRQFVRSWNNDLERYDESREVFAILDRDRFIKTCYRPDPLIHGAATNLDYYLEEKAKA